MEVFCLNLATMLLDIVYWLQVKGVDVCYFIYLLIYLFIIVCVEKSRTSLQFPCKRIKDATFNNLQVKKIMNEYSSYQ